MKVEEYLTHVDETKFIVGDYGKWVKFSESFPPISDKEYDGTLIEILSEGNPMFASISRTRDDEVSFLDYDFNNEFFEYGGWAYLNLYWRFIPEPPDNEGYDCG